VNPRNSSGTFPEIPGAPFLVGVLNMGGPPRTKFVSEQRPINGRAVVFSIPLACARAGWIDASPALVEALETQASPGGTSAPNAPEDPHQRTLALCRERWGGRIESFLDEVRKRGVAGCPDPAVIASLDRPSIGWSPKLAPSVIQAYALCPEIGLTIAVLSRCAGLLYLPRRAPDLTWQHLLERSFAMYAPRLEAVAFVEPAPPPHMPDPQQKSILHFIGDDQQ